MYVLHIAPGADQYECCTREEGIAQALAFQEGHHVPAWLTDDGYALMLLEGFGMESA
jgi:hypothetical protein